MITVMNKLLSLITVSAGFILSTAPVLADVNLQVVPPPNVGITAAPTTVLSSAFKIIFLLAALAVLFMLILGAFQWITSGGEKESVGKARGRITHALIGLVVLALAVVIVKIVGSIVNINPFNVNIPNLNGS